MFWLELVGLFILGCIAVYAADNTNTTVARLLTMWIHMKIYLLLYVVIAFWMIVKHFHLLK